MIHRMLHYPAGWEWQILQQPRVQPSASTEQIDTDSKQSEITTIYDVKRKLPKCAAWLDQCEESSYSQFRVQEHNELGPILYGTLMVQLSDDRHDIQPFYYWMSRHELITLHTDMRLPLRLQSIAHTSKYELCSNAPEAFMIMLSSLIDVIHTGLEQFGNQLAELEASIRFRQPAHQLEAIIERRYDLVHWSQLFVPARELFGAAKETFIHELAQADSFKRTEHKLERMETLLNHYSSEIDTLISMDEAMSSFHGNDMLKSLLTAAILLIPAGIATILWGFMSSKINGQEQIWWLAVVIPFVIMLTTFLYIRLGHRKASKAENKQRRQLRSTPALVEAEGEALSRAQHRKKNEKQRSRRNRPAEPLHTQRASLNSALSHAGETPLRSKKKGKP